MAVEFASNLIGSAQRGGWTNGFVSFLGVFDLAGELSWRCRQKLLTVGAGNFGAHRGKRFFAEHRTVGTHVGDEATLVETLRDTHHLCGTEAKLAAALLLQRAGGERRFSAAAIWLFFNRTNAEGR